MKFLYYSCAALLFLSVGCRTQKIASKPEPVTTETIAAPVAPAPTTTNSSTSAKPKAIVGSVASREERVTAANGEADDLGSKRFYIILGSFAVYENAQNFKKKLQTENFYPGILVNEAGLYRVCVNSYNDEATARARIGELREKFPQYSDLWLLVKKQ